VEELKECPVCNTIYRSRICPPDSDQDYARGQLDGISGSDQNRHPLAPPEYRKDGNR